MILRLAPLLLLVTLQASAAEDERVRYTCDNGGRLDISFSAVSGGRPQATLHFADGDVVLPQVPAASGALYRADPVRLHTKGDEATFSDDKGNVRRCSKGVPAPAPVPAASASFLDLAGTVAWPQKTALPPGAILILRAQDTSRADARALTLAEQRYDLAGQPVPLPFVMTVDRDLVGKRARITLSARIEQKGKLLYINDTAYPAIVDGQPRPVDMKLKAVGPATKH